MYNGRMTLEEKLDIFMEHIDDQFERQAEAMSSMQGQMTDIGARLEHVEELTEQIPAIRAAIVDISGELSNHETRITKLEKKAV